MSPSTPNSASAYPFTTMNIHFSRIYIKSSELTYEKRNQVWFEAMCAS